jgi:hypothetical protein
MQLGLPDLALRGGQPTALVALRAAVRCCLLLKSFKSANLGSKPPETIGRMSDKLKEQRWSRLVSLGDAYRRRAKNF